LREEPVGEAASFPAHEPIVLGEKLAASPTEQKGMAPQPPKLACAEDERSTQSKAFSEQNLRYSCGPVAFSATLTTPSAAIRPPENRLQVPLILLGLALAALWSVCCRHLSAEWSYNEQYNYGWFVPFFALYLFWLRWEDRDQLRSSNFEFRNEDPGNQLRNPQSAIRNRSGAGLLLSIPLLLALLPLRLIEVANPDWRLLSWAHAFVAVGLTLLLVWWIGGLPWLRHFAFPILFFLVAVPWISAIEQPIIQGLMPTVASIATETLSLFGIPAEVRGNLIQVNGGVVGVNEACSGVRSLQTSIMIGLLFGEIKRLGLWQRLFLLVAAIGIAFIANCGRAFFLVWIAATRGVPQVEHWHDMAGYAIVGFVFLGCLGLTKLLAGAKSEVESRKSKVEKTESSESETANPQSAIRPPSFPRSASTFYFLLSTLLWFLAVEIGVETWYRAHESNLQRSAEWHVRWPESAPQFREAKIDERTKSILHFDQGRGAMWMLPGEGRSLTNSVSGGGTALLYFFRWLPGHNSALLANAHRPDVCLPASGWHQTGDSGAREYAVSPELKIPFRHFEFSNNANGRPKFAHAFYCVWEDRVARHDNGTGTAGMNATPSAWTRSERMQSVFDGRRHLGQQVMEYLAIEPQEISSRQAEEAFAARLPELVSPPAAKPL
jgi:exosortase